MGIWVNTRGKSTLGIGLCDRCHFKFSLDELMPDGNAPGLRVCVRCCDEFDPYRLPARQPDDLTLPFYRPQEPLIIPDDPVEPEETFDALTTELEEPILLEDGDYLIPEEAPPAVGPIVTAAIGESGYAIGYDQSQYGSIDNANYYPGLLIRVVQDVFEGPFAYTAFRIYLQADPAGAPPPANIISAVRVNDLWYHVASADINEASGSDRIIGWFGSAGLVDGEQYIVELI